MAIHIWGNIGIFFLAFALVHSESCHDGWVRYHNSCYLFSKSVSDWAGAGYICSKLGGKLVEIETKEEDHFIQTRLQSINLKAAYWNGMNDIEVEGEFKWIDSGRAVNYTHWHPGQPEDAATQNCGIFWSDTGYDWHDYHCEIAEHFICEKEWGIVNQHKITGEVHLGVIGATRAEVDAGEIIG